MVDLKLYLIGLRAGTLSSGPFRVGCGRRDESPPFYRVYTLSRVCLTIRLVLRNMVSRLPDPYKQKPVKPMVGTGDCQDPPSLSRRERAAIANTNRLKVRTKPAIHNWELAMSNRIVSLAECMKSRQGIGCFGSTVSHPDASDKHTVINRTHSEYAL